MLTRAQRKVGHIVLELVEEYGNVLVGGAAMNLALVPEGTSNHVQRETIGAGRPWCGCLLGLPIPPVELGVIEGGIFP